MSDVNKSGLSREQKGLIAITSLGGFLEFYDFIIYALMAGYIAEHFFPGHNSFSSLMTTFATFSAGYFARPLGGLVFGHFGDRIGRKRTFVATVLIMALSTFLMGCLPSYAQVGLLAPVLLVILRILQGFSIGGEIPGAMTYLSETVNQQRGLVMSLLFMALVNGVVFGSLVHAFMLWWLPLEDMKAWGWRVPFWLGGSLGICSYVVRKRFNESALFLELSKRKAKSTVPLLQLFQSHRMGLLTGTLLIIPVATSMTLLFLFTPGYLTRMLDYHAADVAWAGSFGILCSSVVFVLIGLLADRWSPKYLLLLSSCLVSILAVPLFTWYGQGIDVIWVMLASAIVLGTITGIAPLFMSTLFPVQVRYSGIAFCYNIGFALFGGLTPVIAMALISWSNNLQAPAWYLLASGLCGVCAFLILSGKDSIVMQEAEKGQWKVTTDD